MMMKPNPKTPNMVMMMMVVVVIMIMMVKRILLINDSLNGSELVHVARNGYGAFLIKSILFLSFLEELHEERVVDVDNRNNEPLSLLLGFSNHHSQTPLWDVFGHFFIILLMIMIVVMKMNVRNMEVEIHMMMIEFL